MGKSRLFLLWLGVAALPVLLGGLPTSFSRADQITSDVSPLIPIQARFGPYRKLVELSYEAFRAGDTPRAAILAAILERTWDDATQAQQGLGERFGQLKNPGLWKKIDDAMDLYVKPMMYTKKPDPAKMAAAYRDYQATLDLADTVAVDEKKMGPYRALALLAYQAVLNGDWPSASSYARILQKTWETGDGDLLKKNAPETFRQIDNAMKAFITPLTARPQEYGLVTGPSPQEVVGNAYYNYVEKLNLGD